MSAEVTPSAYQWFCSDCAEGDGGYEHEEDADAVAAHHDAANEHGIITSTYRAARA